MLLQNCQRPRILSGHISFFILAVYPKQLRLLSRRLLRKRRRVRLRYFEVDLLHEFALRTLPILEEGRIADSLFTAFERFIDRIIARPVVDRVSTLPHLRPLDRNRQTFLRSLHLERV